MDDSYVCSKAKIKCSCGDKISTLTVYPDRTIWLTDKPQANISDHIPIRNIASFGKCHTTTYPPTAAATAAAHGKLTPMPCMPNTPFPWMGGKNDVLLKGQPALLKSSKCKCVWGGTITITFDGQTSGNQHLVDTQQRHSIEFLDKQPQIKLQELMQQAKSLVNCDIDLSEENIVSTGLSKKESKILRAAVLNERRELAKLFYKNNTSFSPADIEAHICCIDFEKPVRLKTIPLPDKIFQFQYYVTEKDPNTGELKKILKIGDYATPDDEATPSKLGTYGFFYGNDGKFHQKIRTEIKITEPHVVLESTASAAIDNWSLKGIGKKVQTEGGGIQYFIPTI